MRMKFTLLFTISVVLTLLCSVPMNAQQNSITKDTLVYKQKYGLRLGADLSKIARSFFDDNYTGFEVNGDYRLTKRMYLAGELGTEERTINKENISSTAKGSYFKAGVDFNFYKNWLDMENMIFGGFRIGASTFSQTRNSYSIYDVNNQYWNQQVLINDGTEYNGLTALWAELIVGMKAEVITNLYIGVNVQLKYRISATELDNFENLSIPGFNRTYDNSQFGTGFGYNLSYLIPIFKKDKLVIQDVEKEN
ncbi:MAG: hypothetical protein KJO96_08840 [Winogradskyella sp.]|nr:hypothetical protein [Winogradskyella sp.]